MELRQIGVIRKIITFSNLENRACLDPGLNSTPTDFPQVNSDWTVVEGELEGLVGGLGLVVTDPLQSGMSQYSHRLFLSYLGCVFATL